MNDMVRPLQGGARDIRADVTAVRDVSVQQHLRLEALLLNRAPFACRLHVPLSYPTYDGVSSSCFFGFRRGL